jgi:aminoglycoside/choline kinase family phosphotransferase
MNLPHDSSERMLMLRDWLTSLANDWQILIESLQPASSDASFRRYFRVRSMHPAYPSLIVMDAPVTHEDCRPFITVAHLFADAGVQVPKILAQNLTQGFLLLSDLGTITYEQALTAASAPDLYARASQALICIQRSSQPHTLPRYDAPRLHQELSLFDTWYVARHYQMDLSSSQQTALHQVYQLLIENALAQPCVYVHRDYHCRNLMVMPSGEPGILDFQDAVYGPITYDLVSLWRDAYLDWDEALQLDWLARYWSDARSVDLPVADDFAHFYRDYEWMGLQRHLKVLGIFARLSYRDKKNGYLQYLPRVLNYTRQVAQRYPEFKSLLTLLDNLAGSTPQISYTF